MTASAFMRLAYWIMFQFFLFLTPELASKLLPSKSRNGGPVFCVFTRSWSIVVGFAVWEVGCLRAGFNASGRVCHRCVHTELDDVPASFFYIPYSRARKQVTSQQARQMRTSVFVLTKTLVRCCRVCCLGGRLFASGFQRIWLSMS